MRILPAAWLWRALILLGALVPSVSAAQSLGFSKGIHHEFKSDPYDPNGYLDTINGGASGVSRRVGIGLYWSAVEPCFPYSASNPDCDCQDAVTEDAQGHRFCVLPHVDEAIRRYSQAGWTVVGILVGVPNWANSLRYGNPGGVGTPCNGTAGTLKVACWGAAASGDRGACAPDDGADFARFAKWHAQRYKPGSAAGVIAEYVVFNEVQKAATFDVGAPSCLAYNRQSWTETHREIFKLAYDAIKDPTANPSARVMVSLDGYFGDAYFGEDKLGQFPPKLSGKSLIDDLYAGTGVGNRDWDVGLHPYSVDATGTPGLCSFAPGDYPYVNFGTLGPFQGWLRKHYGADRQIVITEVGFDSASSSCGGEAGQAFALCNSFRQAIATPGIEGYIVQRYLDHPEIENGLYLGLRTPSNVEKQSWTTWRDMAWSGGSQSWNCGFENRMPDNSLATVLTRHYSVVEGRHWETTRNVSSTYSPELRWKLARNGGLDRRELFECVVTGDTDHFVSVASDCEGQTPMGSLGFAYTCTPGNPCPPAGFEELFRCYYAPGGHIVNPGGCPPGWGDPEYSLGYAIRVP